MKNKRGQYTLAGVIEIVSITFEISETRGMRGAVSRYLTVYSRSLFCKGLRICTIIGSHGNTGEHKYVTCTRNTHTSDMCIYLGPLVYEATTLARRLEMRVLLCHGDTYVPRLYEKYQDRGTHFVCHARHSSRQTTASDREHIIVVHILQLEVRW